MAVQAGRRPWRGMGRVVMAMGAVLGMVDREEAAGMEAMMEARGAHKEEGFVVPCIVLLSTIQFPHHAAAGSCTVALCIMVLLSGGSESQTITDLQVS